MTAGALLLAIMLLLALAGTALGADPSALPSSTPTVGPAPILIDPLDPRAGDGPSPVGAPLLAFVAVFGLGILVAAATFGYVRLAARRR